MANNGLLLSLEFFSSVNRSSSWCSSAQWIEVKTLVKEVTKSQTPKFLWKFVWTPTKSKQGWRDLKNVVIWHNILKLRFPDNCVSQTRQTGLNKNNLRWNRCYLWPKFWYMHLVVVLWMKGKLKFISPNLTLSRATMKRNATRYPCGYCERTFTQQGNLKTHEKIHTVSRSK